jgi:hypothetical protein
MYDIFNIIYGLIFVLLFIAMLLLSASRCLLHAVLFRFIKLILDFVNFPTPPIGSKLLLVDPPLALETKLDPSSNPPHACVNKGATVSVFFLT